MFCWIGIDCGKNISNKINNALYYYDLTEVISRTTGTKNKHKTTSK